jgi:Mg2+-importing ATPase
MLTSFAVVAVASALPFTPLGTRLGFVALPGLFFLILAGLVTAYLAMVQAAKAWFYRSFAAE